MRNPGEFSGWPKPDVSLEMLRYKYSNGLGSYRSGAFFDGRGRNWLGVPKRNGPSTSGGLGAGAGAVT